MGSLPSSLPDRFIAKVALPRDSDCWLWTGAHNRGGYGRFYYNGKLGMAYRFSFEVLIGPIPAGLQLDHLCREPRCVNPAHLEAVTSRENTLRGDTFQAHNARKTHCPQGHEYTSENTLLRHGSRYCYACKAEGQRQRRRRRRLAQEAGVSS